MNTKALRLLILGSALLPLISQGKPENTPRDGDKGTPPDPAQVIARMDTNGNGTISANEAKGALAKHFARIDADGNGEITQQEITQSRQERKAKVGEGKKKLKAADTDGNGAISADEAAEAGLERLVEHFDKIDADGDGEISKEEMREMAKQKKKRDGTGSE